MIRRHHNALRALLVGAVAAALAGCSENLAERAVCEGGDGQVSIEWQQVPGIDAYRVFRANDGMTAEPIGEVDGASFVDTGVQNGTRYGYIVRAVVPDGVVVPDVAACAVTPVGDDPVELPAVANLSCRPKDAKVDLAWDAVPGAAGYRVTRTTGGQSLELGMTPATAFADLDLVNGDEHSYAIAAVDAAGNAGVPTSCAATPIGRDVVEAVSTLACRAKRDKVDLSWPAASGAESYQILRAIGAETPVEVGETDGVVYADFGLVASTTYAYTVRARRGAELAAPSPICNATPGDRLGNLAPEITSSPLTTALAERVWYYDVEAIDADGSVLVYALEQSPPDMTVDPTSGLLVWSPLPAAVGPHPVRVRVTDAQGASAVQIFSIEVGVGNEAPRFVSTPLLSVQVGESYRYDADAFDPDGDPVRFEFATAPPAGVAIDGASGVITWAPAASDAGAMSFTLRALDPAGNEAPQQWSVQVLVEPLAFVAPVGPYEMRVGETLLLPLETNYGSAAGFVMFPIKPSARITPAKEFEFKPEQADVGTHDFYFKAKIGTMRAMRVITVNVVRGAAPPAIAPIAAQIVKVGAVLRFSVVASDPDGDAVSVSAPGLSIANAFFDQLGSAFEFRPAADQVGDLNVTFAASDGQQTVQATVPITVEAGDPTSEELDLVVDPPPSPTFSTATRITGSVVGEVRPPEAPEPPALITGMSPAAVRQGRSVTVDLTGIATAFESGATSADFGAGITVETLEVLSPTLVRVTVRAASNAALGPRPVSVTQGDLVVPSLLGLLVEAGAASVTGTLRDPFTEQPIVGARVTVNGSLATATTGADGSFVLEGVPPGLATILFTAPNFESRQVDLAVEANREFRLDEPVTIDALARPFQPGGSLPRAARLASILDRGISEVGGEITQEQAEAAIEDTLLVVGGAEVGVFDEAGNQLNPALDGPGIMTVTRAGVRAQAVALIEGDVVSLREVLSALQNMFQWLGDAPMTPTDGIAVLQSAVDEAWQNPLDPDNAMAIVLFNEGRGLSSRPPQLTPDTQLNRFQSFLLVTSFLMNNYATLSSSADEAMRSRGVDPAIFEDADKSVPPDVIERLRVSSQARDFLLRALAATGDLIFGAAAHAQTGTIINTPNSAPNDPNARYEQIWKKAKWEALKSATFDSAVSLGTYAAATMIMAQVAGSTGGAPGAAAGVAIAMTVVDGVISALVQKLFLLVMLDATIDALAPQPPVLESATIAGNKVYLVFATSVTEQVNDAQRERIAAGLPPNPGSVPGLGLRPEVLRYTYQLYRFRNAVDNEIEAGALENGAFLRPVPDRDDKLQFVIPYSVLKDGPNYFRVRTVQYVNAASDPPRNRTVDVPLAPSSVALTAASLVTKIRIDLSDAEIELMKGLTEQEYQSQFGAINDELAANNDLAIAARKLRMQSRNVFHDRAVATHAARVEGFAATPQAATARQSQQLIDYAKTPGIVPENFEIPLTPEYSRAQQILGIDENTEINAELQKAAKNIAIENRATERAHAAIGKQNRALQNLESAKAGLQRRIASGDTDGRFAGQTGSASVGDAVDTTVHWNVEKSAAGVAQIDELIELEKTKIATNTQLAEAAKQRLAPHEVESFRQHVGDAWDLFQHGVKLDAERARQANQARVDAIPDYLHAEKQSLAAARRTGRVKLVNDVFRAFGALMDRVSPGLTGISIAQDLYSGLSVIGGQFSAPFMFVRGATSGGLAPSLEFHPDFSAFRGLLVTRTRTITRPPPNPPITVGDLVTAFPTDDIDSDFVDAPPGSPWAQDTLFPPDFLAIDSDSIVYTINKASYDAYGGRIFRFIPQSNATGNRRFAREYAGNVSYYNLNLQYGHPAAPVAMTIAPSRYDGSVGEDLFIANSNYVQDRKEIVRVPVSQIKRRPTVYGNGPNRNSLAGQPYASHPEFDLRGPADLISAPLQAPDGTPETVRRMYLTDQGKIFVILENLQTGGVTVTKIHEDASGAGHRYSGMAFDSARTLYVADHASGDIFVIPASDLRSAESGTPLCMLRATKSGRELNRPVFLAIDAMSTALVASTESAGLMVVGTLPALVKVSDDRVQALNVDRLGKRTRLTKIDAENALCADYYQIDPSEGDVNNGGVSLRALVRRDDGSTSWIGQQLTFQGLGATVLDLVIP